ncbi:MAG: SpoIIE family protein phosphatase [Bacteroidia bacterium]
MKKQFSIVALLIAFSVCLYAGDNRKADSLLHFIARQAPDTALVNALNDLSHVVIDYPDSSYAYASSALELSKKLKFPSGQARASANIGEVYNAKGNYDQALKSLYDAYHIYEKIGNKRAMNKVMNSIGNTHIGNNDRERALTSFRTCYAIGIQLKDSSAIALATFGIGNIFGDMGKTDSAMKYLNIALPAFQRQHYTYAEAMCYTLLGQLNDAEKKYDEALISLNKGMDLFQQIGQAYGIGMAYQAIGKTWYDKGNRAKALENYLAAYNVHLKRNAYDNLKDVCENISKVYKDAGDYNNALVFHERYMVYKDSVFNERSHKQLLEVEAKYQTENKEKEIRLKNLALEKSNSEVKSRTILLYVFGMVTLILLVMGFFIYRQYKEKKIANIKISRQKDIIELRNKHITDSIRYAKYIQSAILPDDDMIYQIIGECFLLYRPKDIVSGDFYWIHATEKYVYVAAVDCTGHGVPGAFLSLVGHNGLSNAITQLKEPGTAEALAFLQQEVTALFRNNYQSSNVRDGMDISLVRIDKKNFKMQFSGANSPVCYIRNNALSELRGDKLAISAHNENRNVSFTQHEIDLEKGDVVYLFSDGYADQFGGPKGKKFKYKQFQEVLMACHKLPMNEQKNFLLKTTEDWRGNLEQIDDIMLIGFRI